MKTFTVDFATIKGLGNTAGVEVQKGITLNPISSGVKISDKLPHLRLGEITVGSYWNDVWLSKKLPPFVDNNNIVHNAGLFEIPGQKYVVLDKPPVDDFGSILVRIKTKNQMKFNLNPSPKDDGYSIIADGTAHDLATKLTWADILVELPLYNVVAIGTPEDPNIFGIVNSGGIVQVVTCAEYEQYFVPHIKLTAPVPPVLLTSDPARIDVFEGLGEFQSAVAG